MDRRVMGAAGGERLGELKAELMADISRLCSAVVGVTSAMASAETVCRTRMEMEW